MYELMMNSGGLTRLNLYQTDEPNDSEVRPAWEEYDSHNDETFGEEISTWSVSPLSDMS